MKTKIALLSFLSLLTLLLLDANNLIAKNGGSPGGRSSSGGDFGASCGQGGCHGGGHITQNGIITTNIPSRGYTPGSSYTIVVAGTSGSGSKFGFELAAENSINSTAGTLVNSSVREKVLTNGHATHTSAGNTGTAGNFGWTLNWTAPVSGTGAVTFSTAVIVANGNNATSGDSTRVFSITLQESTTTNINETELSNTKLFPIPVVNYLNISSELKTQIEFSLFNMEGKLLANSQLNPIDKIDLTRIGKGFYFVVLTAGEAKFVKKIIKA